MDQVQTFAGLTLAYLPYGASALAIAAAGWAVGRMGRKPEKTAPGGAHIVPVALPERTPQTDLPLLKPSDWPGYSDRAPYFTSLRLDELPRLHHPLTQSLAAIPYIYQDIIAHRVMAAGATGILIGPGVDIPVLVAIWIEGAGQLAETAGFDIGDDTLGALITAVLSAGATWMAAGVALDMLTFWFPGANIAVNGFVNAFYTFRFLKAVSHIVDNPAIYGDLLGPLALDYISGILGNHWPNVVARDLGEVARILDLI